jgi:hypothetical protein
LRRYYAVNACGHEQLYGCWRDIREIVGRGSVDRGWVCASIRFIGLQATFASELYGTP